MRLFYCSKNHLNFSPFSEAVFTEYIFVETKLAAARQTIDQPLCILRRDKHIRRLILAAESGRRAQNGISLDSDVADDLRSFTAKQKMLLLSKAGQWNIQPPAFIASVRYNRGKNRVALGKQVGVQVLINQFDCFYLVHEGLYQMRWMRRASIGERIKQIIVHHKKYRL